MDPVVSVVLQILCTRTVVSHYNQEWKATQLISCVHRDVITKSHPWILTLSISTTYVIWGSSLILYVSDLGEFYHEIVAGIQADNGQPVTPYSPPDGYDPLGYGQVKYSINIILIFAS